ncbi:MAG: NADH dehydrogenase (quinone) subunit D [Candidatus Kuenenia stuttgartiensis]|uniref:NADH-quinone oxidoreductase subunit D n=1 Tax=Kuenenia stuttgartiensis TaxID=174633 RepID=Q1PWG8_KUEST|nr:MULTISPECIES: NADH dehydrogenase (quinone) subunit D [Kuenenia]MBW7941206.1 NADH dehydrogenase (quinone) subunit D [Candidatus Kuenenia stuttgartiensis]MBZ0190904.1 NADH dehydrogenase (quinone) subunit D [Candidatus Kuenenia stuttgartiensis]MCL4727346.1 NADH dehydrogenase (quinone) subunit D [Candidatus Kuenenia stuttgartiensis]MCZ7622918.1 NADH dehydrogenase (quinone) subunit D [Candidatus Kuenenia sp.]CAJ71570.1 strongly similar to to proton-translocating NADH dehydrogenase I 49 kDa subun
MTTATSAKTTHMMSINMGPQHPSTHGVLRLILEMDGETITKAAPDIGFLHRGVEKLAEYKTYHQFIPLTDRLDYVAPFSNNLAYALAVEKLIGVEIPERAQHIRVMLCELTRISSHLLWLATHALDLGAMTVFFYCFRERETLYDIFEMVSGSRMNLSYIRIGGVAHDLPGGFLKSVEKFVNEFPSKLKEYEILLKDNPIWKKRTIGVGYISPEEAIDYGLSGPSLRGSGVDWDVRKAEPYSSYDKYDFNVPLGVHGDVYDRYRVRIEEMIQSNNIVKQALDILPKGDHIAHAPAVALPAKEAVETNMEAMIHHFKLITDGICPPKGEVYSCVEAPKGELGFYIVSDGSNRPYRLKIRPPSFVNLEALPKMVEGKMLPDVVAVIGSLDIVLGEIDR